MRQIILIRHSNSIPNDSLSQRDWGLSEKGRDRAVQLAERLRPYQLQALYASPEVKARQTAELAAGALGIPWSIRDGVEEQGGRDAPWIEDYQAFLDRVEAVLSFPTELIHGSETGQQTQVRFTAAVQQLLNQFPEGNLGIVTHGRVLTLYLAHHTKIEPVPFWQSLTMPCFIPLTFNEQTLLTESPTVIHLA